MEAYIDRIIDHFYGLKFEDIPDGAVSQVRRALLDYMGCAAYTAHNGCCRGLVETVCALGREGEASVWADGRKFCAAAAAFANAARTSNIELDDVSGIGASVHPGVYVWSAAFAAWQENRCSEEDFIRGVLFGYELCMRMGLLSTQQVRNLGLHGPGMNGAFAALGAAGIIMGLDRKQLRNAFGIVGSLLPICPFISFMEGTDSKDMYGGWGVYLAMFAVRAAKNGQTGPEGILDGKKSLISIYCGEGGKDMPLGEDYMINHISFKEFSACASVHPAMTAVLAMKKKHDFSADDVESVSVETYPYSFALNSGVGDELNVSSARLSLRYTVAVALYENCLMPGAFTKDSLKNEKYLALRDRVSVSNHTEYGDSAFSIRGCIVEVKLKDGRAFREESLGSRWSKGVTDEQLRGKFRVLSEGAFAQEEKAELEAKIGSFGAGVSPEYFIRALAGIRAV